MNYKNLIDSCNNSKICFETSVRGDTNRGIGSFKIRVTTIPTEVDETPITTNVNISKETVQSVFNNLSGVQSKTPTSEKGRLD